MAACALVVGELTIILFFQSCRQTGRGPRRSISTVGSRVPDLEQSLNMGLCGERWNGYLQSAHVYQN